MAGGKGPEIRPKTILAGPVITGALDGGVYKGATSLALWCVGPAPAPAPAPAPERLKGPSLGTLKLRQLTLHCNLRRAT